MRSTTNKQISSSPQFLQLRSFVNQKNDKIRELTERLRFPFLMNLIFGLIFDLNKNRKLGEDI